MTKPVYWSTQGGEFSTYHTSKVEKLLHILHTKKIVTLNLHVDELQINHM